MSSLKGVPIFEGDGLIDQFWFASGLLFFYYAVKKLRTEHPKPKRALMFFGASVGIVVLLIAMGQVIAHLLPTNNWVANWLSAQKPPVDVTCIGGGCSLPLYSNIYSPDSALCLESNSSFRSGIQTFSIVAQDHAIIGCKFMMDTGTGILTVTCPQEIASTGENSLNFTMMNCGSVSNKETQQGQPYQKTGAQNPLTTQNPAQTVYQNLSLITPYVNESDVSSVNEAYSNVSNSPWGFRHVGIDFMTKTDLVPVQAVTDGIITSLNTSKESEQQGWHTSICIGHDPYMVCYNFETFSPDQAVGDKQSANMLVKNGDRVRQGDLIGRLVHGGDGAHIDFGVSQQGKDRSCPEPYFTEEARASVMRLIHKEHPDWQMCYFG